MLEVDDPVNCEACCSDVRLAFWDRRRHDNHRLAIFFDRMDKAGRGVWCGDRESGDYHYPGCLTSPFPREEIVKGYRGRIEMMESGGGLEHNCAARRVPRDLPIRPFLGRGKEKPKPGNEGYEVTIRFHVGGMVDQCPGGRWEWVGRKTVELMVPVGLRDIFGPSFYIDGWIRIMGEAASRRKRRTVEFVEFRKGALLENVPASTKVKVEWEDWLIPAPCFGMTIWVICAEVVKWGPAS